MSWAFGKIASTKWPKPLNRQILKRFASYYKIDLSELENKITDFPSLQAFFTRKLKAGARPLDTTPNAVISPADGVISQYGKIEDNRLIQVKGKYYTLDKLLKDSRYITRFQNGSFMTIYLSPHNYHRVHAPLSGKITALNYIKGTLFPVNSLSVNNIDELFIVNERVVTYIEDPSFGTCAVVMVGATNVGAISMAFTDLTTNHPGVKAQKRHFDNVDITAGDELGCFNFGSTVVLLFEKDRINLSQFKAESEIAMGEGIATLS